jgi:hypothetical protein
MSDDKQPDGLEFIAENFPCELRQQGLVPRQGFVTQVGELQPVIDYYANGLGVKGNNGRYSSYDVTVRFMVQHPEPDESEVLRRICELEGRMDLFEKHRHNTYRREVGWDQTSKPTNDV